MAQLIIQGPTPLRGEWHTAGSKNAVLPMLAASLLCSHPVELTNVPDLSDVTVMCEILESLGAKVTRSDHIVRIDAQDIHPGSIPSELTAKMRASVLVLGAAVARTGNISVAQPGGDIIGARPIASHLKAFRELGYSVEQTNGNTHLSGKAHGGRIVLGELSVTGAENAIMAACLASGQTELRMVAVEPHVIDLCDMLVAFGATIEGIGTHNLIITGAETLQGGTWRVPPDQLESGTIAIAAAATQGDVIVHDFVMNEHDALLTLFDEIGVNYTIINPITIQIKPSKNLKATNVRTQPYPNFPSDLQTPLAVLLTQCDGTSEIFETLYEGRLQYLFELQRMGASIAIRDAHSGIITGPTPLIGTELVSYDIRAGATMLLAGMIAQGTTTLDRIEHIDRGYEHIDVRLNALGANLIRKD
ncbi:MAG: UDP-N-acetylglucosamine 1-carboxyvinyltransferase [bacterium]